MVKPIVSVGGIDVVLDFLTFSIYGIINSFTSPLTQLQVTEMIVIPFILCQTLSHSLCFGLHNKEIREIKYFLTIGSAAKWLCLMQGNEYMLNNRVVYYIKYKCAYVYV